MNLILIVKALILGTVEGITEWLPISSSGHMILVEDLFLKLENSISPDAWEVLFVVIQFGAIMAVVVLYFWQLLPWGKEGGAVKLKKDTLSMWGKIIVACIPAAIVGVLFDKQMEELFYHPIPVAIMLIIFGVIFLVVERHNKNRQPTINAIRDISYKVALWIGLWQLIAAIFPGTSRSGATIIGALLIGVARPVAAEFTFFLAVPVMLGASLLKLAKYVLKNGFDFGSSEILIFIVGIVSAFLVSLVVIRFLMAYIKKHDFTAFGWYRIALGILVIILGLAFPHAFLLN